MHRDKDITVNVVNKKRVAVEELQLGMWVVELDRPWLGTPFDFQGFPVVSDEQLETVRGFCRHVFIDPEREVVEIRRRAAAALRAEATPVDTLTNDEDLAVAREVYDECQKAISDAIHDLRVEAKLDADRLSAATADMTATIQKHPQTVRLLHKLHQKSDYELRRAMDSSILMITFGRHLDYKQDRLEILGLAGMLLDVGKVKLPDELLKKTGMLTPAEYQLMKTHVMHSVDLVRSASGRLPRAVEDIIVQHHERQDGSGYPHGLRGGDISIDGAIAAIVDNFSAMTSESCFAGPMTPSNALMQIHDMRGSCFNESLVERFIECVGAYPIGSAVELNTGEIGVVVSQNPERKLHPSVMLVLDRSRKQLPHPQLIIDLAKAPRTKAGEPYQIRRGIPMDGLPIDPNDVAFGWSLPPREVRPAA